MFLEEMICPSVTYVIDQGISIQIEEGRIFSTKVGPASHFRFTLSRKGKLIVPLFDYRTQKKKKNSWQQKLWNYKSALILELIIIFIYFMIVNFVSTVCITLLSIEIKLNSKVLILSFFLVTQNLVLNFMSFNSKPLFSKKKKKKLQTH